MKIVVFAAGEGIRMRPLTLTTPKPLLKYRDKTNLDHLFEMLPKEIDEAIISVKYLGKQIREYCGHVFHGRKISYIEGSKKGNAIGFLKTKKFFAIDERFAVAYGDEVFDGDEISRCFEHEFSWICYPVRDPTAVGIVSVNYEGLITDVVEKSNKPDSNLAADGFMIVNTDIFSYDLQQHQNGEFYFSDLMKQFIKHHDVFAVMGSAGHTQLTAPSDIDRLNLNK